MENAKLQYSVILKNYALQANRKKYGRQKEERQDGDIYAADIEVLFENIEAVLNNRATAAF